MPILGQRRTLLLLESLQAQPIEQHTCISACTRNAQLTAANAAHDCHHLATRDTELRHCEREVRRVAIVQFRGGLR